MLECGLAASLLWSSCHGLYPQILLFPLGNLEQSRHGLSKIKAPAMPQYPLINDFLLVFPLRSSFLGHSLSGQRMSPASNWTPSEAISGFSADKLPVLYSHVRWIGSDPWEHRETFLFSVQPVSPTSSGSSGPLC